MNEYARPIDRMHAAIEKLEALQAESHNWRVSISADEDGPQIIHDFDTEDHGPGTGPLAWTTSEVAAENVVTLHRTIDAQIALLQFGVKRQEALDWTAGLHSPKHEQAASLELQLADAILGRSAQSAAPDLTDWMRAEVVRFGIHPELDGPEWVVHHLGPDDVLPATNMLDAIRQAHAINEAAVAPGGYYGDATEPRPHMTFAWAMPTKREWLR